MTTTTAQKLGLYKIANLDIKRSQAILKGVIESLGLSFGDEYTQRVEGKIIISTLMAKGASWGSYTVSSIKLHFSHEADNHKSTYKSVKIIDGAIDLDRLKTKIAEMLDLYAEADARLSEQKQSKNAMRDRVTLLSEECESLGVWDHQRFGAICVDKTIESSGVNLRIQGLTPDQARAIVRLLDGRSDA